MNRTVLPVVLVLALLSGCATTRGPAKVLSSTGHYVTADHGVAAAFKVAADRAEACRERDEQIAPDNPSGKGKPAPANPPAVAENRGGHCAGGTTAAAKEMLRTGYALIYANCNDFFSSAGKTQKWLIFSRDVVGAVGTLATAVLALHEASDNAVANVGLATGAAFSGMDIYTRNFLFSAENVDSVRELILKALDVHRLGVAPLPDESYESATLTLLDNQNICTPMSITALVREAIKKGDVVASTNSDDRITDIQDEAVLQSLGRKLQPPGALTMDQAGALYWLIRGSATAEQRKTRIKPNLAALDPDKSPLDADGVYKANWAQLDAVSADLGNFSDATKKRFKEAIAAENRPPDSAEPAEAGHTLLSTTEGARGTINAGAAKPRPVTFDRPARASGGESERRVSVGIR